MVDGRKNNKVYEFKAGRGSGKTNTQLNLYKRMYRREFMHNLWMWMCLISAILACFNSFRCIAYSRAVTMLKEDKEALNAEIELLKEQKDRLENDARYCLEMQDSIKDSCRPCLEAQ